jgi:hypothetical protein
VFELIRGHATNASAVSARSTCSRSTAKTSGASRLRIASAGWPVLLRLPHEGIAINEHFSGDGGVIYKHACALGCEGIVSKRLGSPYRAGRSAYWLKVKNPAAPAVKREGEEEWR